MLLEVKDLHAGIEGKEILKGLNLQVNKGEVHAIMGPNGSGKSTLSKVLAGHPSYEVIVTAEGDDSDFVSRMFAPRIGIPEDPVTGAIHCSLIPYWAERLSKSELFARQVSKRGGELFCQNVNGRVKIGGNAVLYLKGEIYV